MGAFRIASLDGATQPPFFLANPRGGGLFSHERVSEIHNKRRCYVRSVSRKKLSEKDQSKSVGPRPARGTMKKSIPSSKGRSRSGPAFDLKSEKRNEELAARRNQDAREERLISAGETCREDDPDP